MRFFDEELSARKSYYRGAHRCKSPSQTLATLRPHLRSFGITRVANVTGLDVIGLPVYVAIRPTSRGLSTSQGKGADDESARVSAIMESIESWYAERLSLPIVHESVRELRKRSSVIDIDNIPRPGNTEVLETAPMAWVEGYDLLSEQRTWVPYECISTNTVPTAAGRWIFPPSSNGLASGNHLLEAIQYSLCELIERDAVANWLAASKDDLNKLQLPVEEIARKASEESGIPQVLRLLDAARVDCSFWELTSDIGVPVFACYVFDSEDRPSWRSLAPFAGYGCHLSSEVALLRALTEAIQSRLSFISGSRDDLLPEKYAKNTSPEEIEEMRSLLRAAPSQRVFRPIDLSAESLEEDVAVTLQMLQRSGYDSATVVDISRDQHGVSVVKSVIPGLRSMTYQQRASAQRGQ